jgi:hypothetical protein
VLIRSDLRSGVILRDAMKGGRVSRGTPRAIAWTLAYGVLARLVLRASVAGSGDKVPGLPPGRTVHRTVNILSCDAWFSILSFVKRRGGLQGFSGIQAHGGLLSGAAAPGENSRARQLA